MGSMGRLVGPNMRVCMRVALFFDGKNHMKDLRRAAEDRWIDHGALADWIVAHVGGERMVGAYYYTGVPNPQEDSSDRRALSDLLDELEKKAGFFVKRFNRRASTRDCPHCARIIAYTEEKMVDTSLVADMITLATRDAYDIAVVFSGDLDVAPALTAAQALGKQAWIATFGDFGLSRSLTRAAWDRVDLLEHFDEFAYPELAMTQVRRAPAAPDQTDREVLRELRRAEAHFMAGGGFVGAHYFIHRWKGHSIPDAPDDRRQSVQRLIELGQAETYLADGKTALRTIGEEPTALEMDDEETVEMMRVTESMRRLRQRMEREG